MFPYLKKMLYQIVHFRHLPMQASCLLHCCLLLMCFPLLQENLLLWQHASSWGLLLHPQMQLWVKPGLGLMSGMHWSQRWGLLQLGRVQEPVVGLSVGWQLGFFVGSWDLWIP
jgi:hypothetical protein